jgi:hypothetical protein
MNFYTNYKFRGVIRIEAKLIRLNGCFLMNLRPS